MPRIHYDNKIYLQKQRQAILNSVVLSNRDMAIKLGVTMVMWKRYMSGQSPIPMDMLYLRARDDVDIAVFGSSFVRELWSL